MAATTTTHVTEPPTGRLGEATAEALPVDILLEIAARSGVLTIVRFAAVSRSVRRAILDQGFRRSLDLRAAASGGFDTDALLRGISYKLKDDGLPAVRVVQAGLLPPSTEPLLVHFDASLSLEPVASRDGLVVLRRLTSPRTSDGPPQFDAGLRICNSIITGHTSSLPPIADGEYHTYALITVQDMGRSFELLVADEALGFQIYSSRDGRWSAVRSAHLHRPSRPFHRSYPLVIGRTVHWLCCRPDLSPWMMGPISGQEPHVVALHADTGQATVIELPQGCISRMVATMSHQGLILATSADGRLSVVVSEAQKISVWTMSGELSSAVSWSRRVLIDKQRLGVHNAVQFQGFGERSGTVILHIAKVGLVRLNLAKREAFLVHRLSRRTDISQVCLHEFNLASLLQAMKQLS